MAKLLRTPNRWCLALAVVISFLLVTLFVLEASATDTAGAGATNLSAVAGALGTTTWFEASPASAKTGSTVRLRAYVVDDSGGLVTRGTVTFFDGERVLGTVQIAGPNPGARSPRVITGDAILTLRFGPGTHALSARFNGVGTKWAASDSWVQLLSVTGTQPSNTYVTASANGKNYDLTAKVAGFGWMSPAGSVSFANITTGADLGSAVLDTNSATQTFVQSRWYLLVGQASSVAVADLDGDGLSDLLMGDLQNLSITVARSYGDGSFQPTQSYYAGHDPLALAVGDFNGDGLPDVAVLGGGWLSIFLDDSYWPGLLDEGPSYAVKGASLHVADVNGDGVSDIVVADQLGSDVSVLLGRGDGSFQAPYVVGVFKNPISPVVGDFNGDGAADIAIAEEYNDSVDVLLGDPQAAGQFQAPRIYAVGRMPYALAVADLNGDGVQDLAVANSGDRTVGILMGGPDGSFSPQQIYATANSPVSLVVADFTGDGILDLAVQATAVQVFVGVGDGTFKSIPESYGISLLCVGLATGDLNGDGLPDLVSCPANNRVLLRGTQVSARISNVPIYGTGTQSIGGSYIPYAGSEYQASTGSTSASPTGRANTSIGLVAAPSSTVAFGTAMSIAATIAQVNGAPTPTGTLVYQLDGAANQGVALTNASVILPVPTVAVGSHVVNVTYSGDNQYDPATNSLTLTVTPAAPVLTVICPAATYDGKPHACTSAAKGIDGADVRGTFTFNYTLNGSSVINPVAQGNYTVTASFTSADANYTNASGAGTLVIGGVAVSPMFLTFPDTNLASASSSLYVTVTNQTGNALAVSPGISPNFVVSNNQCGTSVASGVSCRVYVQFRPITAGPITGTLTVASQTVTLAGSGIAHVDVTPASLTFAATNVGGASSSLYITITNQTGAAMTLDPPVVSTNFVVSGNQCTGPIAQGAGCRVYVQLRPTVAGPITGTLVVASQTVTLAGNGIGHVDVTPVLLTFAATNVGGASSSLYVTITNQTGATMALDPPVVSPNFFVSGNQCVNPIAQGSGCRVYVQLRPTIAGPITGTLTVASQTVTLAGSGIGHVDLTPTLLNFPDTNVGGASSSLYVTVTNNTGSTLPLSPASSTNFIVSNNGCGASISQGGSCRIYVQFRPTSAGTLNGALALNDSWGTSAVPLTGTAH